MPLNAQFWVKYFQQIFIAEVEMYIRVVEERLLPVFDTVDEEATELAQKEFDERMAQPADDYFDPADAAYHASEQGLVYYELLSGVRQSLLNIAAVHLHHLFEQHLFAFYKKELLSPQEEMANPHYSLSNIRRRLEKYNIDISKCSSWSKIDELRLVANTAKHGEGKSSEKLKLLRPEMFVHPTLRDDSAFANFGPGSAERPLSGSDFFVLMEDFKEYTQSVLRFWNELSDALIAL